MTLPKWTLDPGTLVSRVLSVLGVSEAPLTLFPGWTACRAQSCNIWTPGIARTFFRGPCYAVFT